jgi:hypothetical protein
MLMLSYFRVARTSRGKMRKMRKTRKRKAWWEIWAEFGKKTLLYTLATFHNQPNSSQYQQQYYYLHHIQTNYRL